MDIFGKRFEEFEPVVVPSTESDDQTLNEFPPLIFWILIGFWYDDPSRFNVVGLFRVTSSDAKVRTLEHHLSQGNYEILKKPDAKGKSSGAEPHTVANYLKRLLRESRYPLIPKQQYDAL